MQVFLPSDLVQVQCGITHPKAPNLKTGKQMSGEGANRHHDGDGALVAATVALWGVVGGTRGVEPKRKS